MAIQKYPVGHQDFGKIRTEGFVYIDKTNFIHDIVTKGGYYFLSRPRRFGKSLLISTMECVMKGQKELFEGLYIHDKWTFEEYPVIRISFSNIGYRDSNLENALKKTLDSIAFDHDITLKNQSISQKFKELIITLKNQFQKQVVILIDEYDKPIIDYLDQENIHKARENRGILKTFYSVLKDADPYLKLVFITGVSKFSQVSIFSDLNNLNDLTLSPNFSTICGITQDELEANFTEELKIYDAVKIKEWYNGYRWDMDRPSMYNPFSLLKFFTDNGKFFNHWFATGTPTFLMDMSKDLHFFRMEKISASTLDLQSFDIDNILLTPVLFQTGYLTMVNYDSVLNNYILSFPNIEVKEAYLQRLADTYITNQSAPAKQILTELLQALKSKDFQGLQNAINQAYSHIPYPLWQKENEHFYHAIIHLLFSLLGVYIHSEVHTKDGRADAIINIDEGIFCLEFKLDKTAQEAVQQVKDKGYLDAYRHLDKPCYIIGINFSSKDKAVQELLFLEG